MDPTIRAKLVKEIYDVVSQYPDATPDEVAGAVVDALARHSNPRTQSQEGRETTPYKE